MNFQLFGISFIAGLLFINLYLKENKIKLKHTKSPFFIKGFFESYKYFKETTYMKYIFWGTIISGCCFVLNFIVMIFESFIKYNQLIN